jgi:hypothetical protein
MPKESDYVILISDKIVKENITEIKSMHDDKKNN